MNKKFISIKTIVVIGIGAALMFVLNRFLAIPTGVPSTNLNLGIAILAVFSAIFGPVTGFLIGFIGHTLTDLTFGDLWWTWVTGSALFGFSVGVFWKFYKIEEGGFGKKQAVIFNGIQIIANIIIWVAIAPAFDIFILKEPVEKVYLQGIVAGFSNAAVVLILGTLLLFGYTKTMTKFRLS
jgi:energy-coupling factor transport system substrate-specific component